MSVSLCTVGSSSGGGGITNKFQEFTSSGTFTPPQALIDAGGYIEVFLVAGGGGGRTNFEQYGADGGEAQIKSMYLTNTSGCAVTIGAGGTKSTSVGNAGGNSVFAGASAGGVTITSLGGQLRDGNVSVYKPAVISQNGGGQVGTSYGAAQTGGGILGYGEGGGTMLGAGTYVSSQKPNSGKGGISGNSTTRSTDGASGYCLIRWYE